MADAKLQSLTEFSMTATALGLTDKEKETALALTQKLGIPLYDAGVIPFVGIVKMQGMIERLDGSFKDEAQALVGKIRSALGDEMQKQLSSLPASLSEKLDGRMEEFVRQLASNVDMAVIKEARNRQTFRLTQIAGAFVLMVALGIAGGYLLGRDSVSGDAAKWSAIGPLPQGDKWLTLARLNDLDKALAQSCATGQRRVIAGGQVCDIPLYISAPVASSKGVDAVKLGIAEWSNWLGVWGLLGVGLVLGVISDRLWRAVRS
ncbi:hypothetical protein ELG97_37150 [Rhizobium leguminosarum]|uniref:hypothetical protein n=1 Tax=Rhizobium leguminosarum TaxID=384 RepID=UPI0010324929|nr:hypothetical protein [Rhizobium leguminosarum]TBE73859.1 hypothetical protein ELG97_37150 [Rhizobium leguminosarum]